MKSKNKLSLAELIQKEREDIAKTNLKVKALTQKVNKAKDKHIINQEYTDYIEQYLSLIDLEKDAEKDLINTINNFTNPKVRNLLFSDLSSNNIKEQETRNIKSSLKAFAKSIGKIDKMSINQTSKELFLKFSISIESIDKEIKDFTEEVFDHLNINKTIERSDNNEIINNAIEKENITSYLDNQINKDRAIVNTKNSTKLVSINTNRCISNIDECKNNNRIKSSRSHKSTSRIFSTQQNTREKSYSCLVLKDYFNVLEISDIYIEILKFIINHNDSIIMYNNNIKIKNLKIKVKELLIENKDNLDKDINNQISLIINQLSKNKFCLKKIIFSFDSLNIPQTYLLEENEMNASISNMEKTEDMIYINYCSQIREIINFLEAKYKAFNNNIKHYQLSNAQMMHLQNLIYILIYNNFSYFTKKPNSLNNIIKRNYSLIDKQLLNSFFEFTHCLHEFNAKIKIVKKNYQCELENLKEETIKVFRESISESKKQIINLVEEKERLSQRLEMEKLKDKYTEVFKIKENIKLKEQEKNKIEEERKQILEKQRKDEYLSKIKSEIEHYKETQKQINEEIKQEIEKQKMVEKEKVEIMLKENYPIVKKRQEEAEKEFIKNIRVKETLKEQREIDNKKLENIILGLKVRPNVSSDPERVISFTKNFENKTNKDLIDIDDKARVFKNVNGFNDNKLFKDQRYKLQAYLSEAGLNPGTSRFVNEFLNSNIK